MVRWVVLLATLSAGCSLRLGTASERFGAKPEALDSDGDGLPDEVERRIGTNPFAADSDGDGILDRAEVGDPNNPADANGDGVIDALDAGTLNLSQTDPSDGSSGGNTPGDDPSAGGDGGGPPSVIPGFCGGTGPLVAIDGGVQACAGDLAKAIFKYGLCTCEDLVIANRFETASLDKIDSHGTPYGEAGSIGANGDVIVNNNTIIRGSVLVGDTLQCLGKLSVSQVLEYASYTPPSPDGCLTVDPQREFDNDNPAFTPCGFCTPAQRLDIAAIVAPFATSNDNESRNIPSPSILDNTPAAAKLSLGCGAYYFTAITAQAGLELEITGRVAIFVAGDVVGSNPFNFTFTGDGELDLFVAGNMNLQYQTHLGDPLKPTRLRVYIGGASFTAQNNTDLNGFFYAPNVDFQFNNLVKVRGGMVTRNATTAQNSTVVYDKGILDLPGCIEQVTEGCTSNLQCGGGNPVCDVPSGNCVDCSVVRCDGPLVCKVLDSTDVMCSESLGPCTACVTADQCVAGNESCIY